MIEAPPEPIVTANRLLAVVDDPDQLPAIQRDLVAAGIDEQAMVALHGQPDLERLAARRRGGAWHRMLRFLSFIATDQAVDLAWYEAALADGRAVLALHVRALEHRRTAVRILRRHGAHFINHYGRMATEDIVAWRGAPPDLHWIHHR